MLFCRKTSQATDGQRCPPSPAHPPHRRFKVAAAAGLAAGAAASSSVSSMRNKQARCGAGAPAPGDHL